MGAEAADDKEHIAALITGYIDNNLDAAGMARLDAATARDPSVAKELAAALLVHHHLHLIHQETVTTDELVADPRATAASNTMPAKRSGTNRQANHQPPRRRRAKHRRPQNIHAPTIAVLGLAAAAVIVLIILWATRSPGIPTQTGDSLTQQPDGKDHSHPTDKKQGINGKLSGLNGTQLRAADIPLNRTVTAQHTTTITLADNSSMEWVAGSSLQKQRDSWQLLSGSVACKVSKRSPDKQLVVTTPQAQVQVLGTSFTVNHKDSTIISVQEGSVRCRRLSDQQELVLQAGQQVDTRLHPFMAMPIPATRPEILLRYDWQEARNYQLDQGRLTDEAWVGLVDKNKQGHTRSVLRWRLQGEQNIPFDGPCSVELHCLAPARMVQVVLHYSRDNTFAGNLIVKVPVQPGWQRVQLAYADMTVHYKGERYEGHAAVHSALAGAQLNSIIIESFGSREALHIKEVIIRSSK